jgi:hypothetical protein
LNLSLFRWLFLLLVLLASPLKTRAATTNFFEGFEAGLTNWVVGDADPTSVPAYWGIVNSAFGGEGTHSGNFKAYCAGIGYGGSTNSPAYTNYMISYLSRTVNLSGMTNATLTFWSRIPDIETDYDYARVFINNTELWSTDQPQANWTLVTLNIEQFIGATQVLTFQFLSDSTIIREGWYLDDITLTDASTPAPPPTNDNFSAAQVLVGSIGSAGGTTRGATSETNELDPGNSIWYRWTPYTNGTVTFRTGGSVIDTLLCVYRGNSFANLVRVACDDNGDTNNASRISFNAAIGTNYYLSIRGAAGAAGFALLSWEQPNGIGASKLPDIFVWTNAPNEFLYGWFLDLEEPTEPGRTLLRVSTATPNIGTGPLELRGSSTTPGVYQRVFRVDGSYYDRFAGNFTFHPGHGHLHFDNWINLHLRSVLTNNGVGDIIASGDKTSFSIFDLTRYSSPPGSPNSGVYSGGLVQGLSVGWADVYSANLPDQWIDVTDVPSGQYWLEAIVDPANNILESNESNNVSRILIDLLVPSSQPPPNDHFSNSIPITTVTGGDVGFNFHATHELGEPTHITANAVRSAWWHWTAPSNMTARISTDGSDFDTVLAIYTGTAVNALSLIASNNDAGVGNNSLVTFNATAGTTYRIVVDGFDHNFGNIQLNVNPAFNDAFANCLVITGVVGSVSGSTRGATRQTGEPNHAGVGSGTGSIWYCWTAPTNGPVTFDTVGSSFDTLLGIYTGATVNGLIAVASDNNSASNGASRVSFNAVANTLYRIAIDGVPGSQGVVKLNWAGPQPPSIVTPPVSTNAPAAASVTFRVVAGGTSPFSYQWRREGVNLTNSDYISGAQSAALTLNKILPADIGAFTVVITNIYGAITSAPVNLIVLDNPRVVYIDHVYGHGGAFVRVPVEIQSLGNEHSVSFALLYDPAILSNPRATNLPPGATLVLNTNQVASGALGLSITLPSNINFGVGQFPVVDLMFNTALVPAGTQTPVGFSDVPAEHVVRDSAGVTLPALFVAGVVTLSPLHVDNGVWSNGVFRLNFAAGSGLRYAVDASTYLTNWTPIFTGTVVGTTFQFSDTNNAPYRFYRARLVP